MQKRQIEAPHFELDKLSTSLIMAIEKIDVTTNEISGDFFDSLDPNSSDVKCFFNDNRIKMDMVRDYVVESKKSVQQLREVADVIFDILKNTEVNGNV